MVNTYNLDLLLNKGDLKISLSYSEEELISLTTVLQEETIKPKEEKEIKSTYKTYVSEKRNKIKEKHPILQICEHIAIGAKHFKPNKKSLKSVQSTNKGGVWAEGTWAPNTWSEGVWATWLEVRLSGTAEEKYGEVIKVSELAKHVMDFWRNYYSCNIT